jgi:hypothetical protein
VIAAPLFTCGSCGAEQWALSAAIAAPADGLCVECRDGKAAVPPPTLGLQLLAAGLPDAHADYLRREAWEVKFRRPWPPELRERPLPRWTFLYGPTGTGKSTAAAILLAEALGAGEHGRWILGATLAQLWVAHENDRSVVLPALASGLLVVDEPLASIGRLTEFVAGRWIGLSTVRDDAKRTTIVTSNLPPVELMRRVPAAASRILSGVVLELDGPDARLGRPS